VKFTTGHYSARVPNRLDITRAGCDRLIAADKEAPGIILAPSARLVFPTLRRLKAARSLAERKSIFAAYAVDYLAEIEQSAERWPYKVDFILAMPDPTLVCFCRPDPEDGVLRCHRVLAAGYLARLGATYCGEVNA